MTLPKTSITGQLFGADGEALEGTVTLLVVLSKDINVKDDSSPNLTHKVLAFQKTIIVEDPSVCDFTLVPTGGEQGRVTPDDAFYSVTVLNGSSHAFTKWKVADSPTPGMQNITTVTAAMQPDAIDPYLKRSGGQINGKFILGNTLSVRPGKIIRWVDSNGVEKFRFQVVGTTLKVYKNTVTEVESWG